LFAAAGAAFAIGWQLIRNVCKLISAAGATFTRADALGGSGLRRVCKWLAVALQRLQVDFSGWRSVYQGWSPRLQRLAPRLQVVGS